MRAVRIASTQPSAVSRSTYDNPHVCVTASHGIDDEASACAILSGILIDLGLAVFHRPQCTVGCIFHFDLRCHPDDQLPNTRLHVMLILCYIPTFFSPHGSRRPVARRPVRVVLSRVNRSRSVNVGKVNKRKRSRLPCTTQVPFTFQCHFHNYYNCTRTHTRDSFRALTSEKRCHIRNG